MALTKKSAVRSTGAERLELQRWRTDRRPFLDRVRELRHGGQTAVDALLATVDWAEVGEIPFGLIKPPPRPRGRHATRIAKGIARGALYSMCGRCTRRIDPARVLDGRCKCAGAP